MAVKVAINGFGRIGRLAFRQMFEAEGYEVVAINDLTSPKMLAHLLKYDTAQGSFLGKIGENKHTVEATEDSIIVDGKEIKIYAIKDAKDCPWGEIGVDVVLECTGFYTSKEKSMAHIAAGAKKVVISAPAGNDLKTIVYSVNEKTLTKDDQVISAASCTTNCLAPMADTLNKTFPIVSGIMTTVHAYTGDQMILDGPQRKGDLRRARAGAQNIVPINERIEKIKKFIDDTESRHGESNLSIVCGDFNLNPFETPMIKTKGMHAVMEKDIAKKGERIVDGDAYKFFYNPMWGFYGDNGKGNVSGTYFLQRSLNVELFWHLLDQVLIRKGLIDYFEDSQLDIITTIDGNSLLNRNGSINNKDYSDHLPLKFRINI